MICDETNSRHGARKNFSLCAAPIGGFVAKIKCVAKIVYNQVPCPTGAPLLRLMPFSTKLILLTITLGTNLEVISNSRHSTKFYAKRTNLIG